MKKVAIIGQGYVGLSISLGAYRNLSVVGFDIDVNKVETINKGQSPLFEVSSEDLSKMIHSGNYICTSNPKAISDCSIIIIAVPTPLDQERNPDLSLLISASEIVKDNISEGTLVINESTSFPGTLRDLIKPIIDNSRKKGLLYASSPERVNPGSLEFNQSNTPRLYSGLTEEASEMTKNFYANFCNNLVKVATPEIAESAKLFENTFRQVNIAFVNEFATIMNKLDIPVRDVLEAANTKPFGIMKFEPGIGVGGHCIPVDPSYLAFAAKNAGQQAKFIELANQVNSEMPDYVATRLVEEFGTLEGKTVQVVGIAYKPNVSDFRESPSLALISSLRAKGIVTNWCDPIVGKWRDEVSANLGDADLLVFAVAHGALIEPVQKISDKVNVLDVTGRISGVPTL